MLINLGILVFTLEGYQIWAAEIQRDSWLYLPCFYHSQVFFEPTQSIPLWELSWHISGFAPIYLGEQNETLFCNVGARRQPAFQLAFIFFHHHPSQALPHLNYAKDGIIMRDGLIFHSISSWSQCNTQSSLVHLAGNPISEADFKLPAQLNFHA